MVSSLRLGLLVLVVGAFGCSGGGGTGGGAGGGAGGGTAGGAGGGSGGAGYSSCDYRQATSAENRCKEKKVADALDVGIEKEACRVVAGVFAESRCTSASVIGGCYEGAAGTDTGVFQWYYAPMTVPDAKTECGTFTFLDSYK